MPRRARAPGGNRGGAAAGITDAADSTPQPNPTQAPALESLAAAIEAEHQAATAAARTAIDHAIECGQLLIQAKQQVGHGGWLAWIETNCTFGARQGQKYIRLAEFSAKTPNATLASHLTIDGALAAIAEPKFKPSKPQPKPRWAPLSPPSPAAPVTPAAEFHAPPPGRPRLDLDRLDLVKRQYLDLMAGDKNAFARWVLEHQLRQTDLTPRQKTSLSKVLEALTSYTIEPEPAERAPDVEPIEAAGVKDVEGNIFDMPPAEWPTAASPPPKRSDARPACDGLKDVGGGFTLELPDLSKRPKRPKRSKTAGAP